MWMLRPSAPPREVTIDLPELLVQSLGTGAEFLAHYLTDLADAGANDPKNHPPPLPVMCRICERQITPWWFEKHTEGCTQEYRAESDVSLAQDHLTEHRPAIVKVLDALDPETRQGRPVSGELTKAPTLTAEYKGLPIGPARNSPSDSGKGTPVGTPPRSRESSLSSGIGHSRTKSFAVRRPLSKIVTLLVDLCDTALDISMPAIKASKDAEDGNFRSQSPQSESRISQVQNWQTPSVATSEQEQGLSALISDTENLAQAKVDAVLRHREILEYTERIRVEFNALVLDCIDAAIKKASSIKAGDLSSSSDEEDGEQTQENTQDSIAEEESSVSGYDGSPAMMSSMASALREIAEPSGAGSERRQSSILTSSSTRSSSPRSECPTPRSHRNTLSFLGRSDSINKRGSMLLGSDAGDSDAGMSHSAIIGHRRVESPSSDQNLVRSASSGDRKRRSLRLPNMPSPGRNPSPGRGPAPPASPLRIPKPRLPLGLDSMPTLPSPVTSPPLSSVEHSSPIPTGLRHRRQSSAASSIADLSKPPPSPRLNSISQPPARAVPTSIKDFEIIKPISKGAFGSVYLSKKKSTGDYFAIKCLRKGDMVAKNQVTNVKAERAIMMWQGESDFVAKLYWTFASKDFLFLVMEYLNGGDCASLVKVLGGLPEDWAKKYLAEVVLGVEHLHSRGIVHRDLKPDNLLIDQKGHLKLTDFGLSRMGLIGRQKRALTSPNESAPDLFKYGPFTRTTSIGSSRSASFDLQANGGHSPQSTPVMTPDLAGSLGQPSYFNLSRENNQGKRHSRRESGYRSDSGNSDSFNAMFRNFSLNEDNAQRGEPIAEEAQETHTGGSQSPDPYLLKPTVSNQSGTAYQGEREGTPPHPSMLPPTMALFDPDDQNRRFVGTPDYLAPETINGLGQDEMSDWWSMGCILFEFLYGYPPFHGDSPELVFENILARKIDWPEKDYSEVSDEAKDLMDKLMTIDPKKRLGSNMEEKYLSAGDEIRAHPWCHGINWNTLLEDEAQFIPNPENPEDTEYFDARGATLQTFTEEMEGQDSSPTTTPGADAYDRPHDALSRVRSQVNSMKRGLMPLHIPPHVRDNRSRRLSEPVANDDFGNFAFKNLPVLEKANKEVIQKMRIEAQQKTIKGTASSQPSSAIATAPSLEGSPLLSGPLNRTLSANKGSKRPASPSNLALANPSPSRTSQPSSPLVSFSTGQNHERRKTSSTSSVLSHQSSSSLQPGNFFEPPKLPMSYSTTSTTSTISSPIKSNRHSMNMSMTMPEKPTVKSARPQSMHIPTSRARSQTVGSADGDIIPALPAVNHKRHSQVFDVSPSSSDNEEGRAQALLRVQRRRQSSRSMSQIMLIDGPTFRPLDILICEDHPVSRMVMEKLFEKLKCRTIAVTNGPEAARYAMSQVQFDIIFMEYKLPQINGADVARMIRDTRSANTQTPIVAVTGYLRELPQTHHFDSLIEKPPTIEKITEVLSNLCQWKPPPPGYTPPKPMPQPHAINPSSLRQESRQQKDDSPSSQSSGPFSRVPGLYNPTSREHSIGSSFFGDTDSTNTDDNLNRGDIPVIIGRQSDDWAPSNALGITEEPTTTSATAATIIDKNFIHPGLPHLIHQNSAPSVMSDPRTPRKQRSVEAVKAKREDLMKKRHECAESGDDEDEELGDVQVRAKSPMGKSRIKASTSSKLGIEMMRTNSRGSVTSGGDDPPGSGGPDAYTSNAITSVPTPTPSSTTTTNTTTTTNWSGVAGVGGEGAAAAAACKLDEAMIDADVTHPPEIFPAHAKGDAEEFVDMDATPRPPSTAAIASIEQADRDMPPPRSPSPVKR